MRVRGDEEIRNHMLSWTAYPTIGEMDPAGNVRRFWRYFVKPRSQAFQFLMNILHRFERRRNLGERNGTNQQLPIPRRLPQRGLPYLETWLLVKQAPKN